MAGFLMVLYFAEILRFITNIMAMVMCFFFVLMGALHIGNWAGTETGDWVLVMGLYMVLAVVIAILVAMGVAMWGVVNRR